MSSHSQFESRFRDIDQQIETLTQRVAHLEETLADRPLTASVRAGTTPVKAATAPAPEEAPNRVLNMLGGSSLLPRIATLCFLLVIALVLRTLTDSGILDAQIGSVIGMVYAAVLMFIGWLQYRKNDPLAPVFSISGGLLMFSIVHESHARFASISSELAYLILALTGMALSVTSYQNQVRLPILLGALGMCLSSVAIDWPLPFFPYLLLVLWLSILMSCFATRLKRCSWLRIFTLVATLHVMTVWWLKLEKYTNVRIDDIPAILAPGWVYPITFLLSGTLLAMALFGIVRSGGERISKFDLTLPLINVVWAHLFLRYQVQNIEVIGALSTLVAFFHFGIAWKLAQRKLLRAPGTNAFTMAGAILLCLALPDLFGNILYALPLLSLVALTVNYFADRWHSGGMRLTAYLLQVVVTIGIIWVLVEDGVADHLIDGLVVSAICGLLSIYHYRYCRKNPPAEESQLFSQFDSEDQSAISILLAGLTNGFFMTMVLVYQGLLLYPDAQIEVAFTAIQSVVINGVAMVIMSLALAWRNKELRNVAILITIIGGLKVFLGDLLSISGLGLVVSVFSFGVAASLESYALTRWQKLESWEKRKQTDAGENSASERSKTSE
ncbi:MAG: hypothetical protein P1P74_12005 [Desulfuromonadales bacterium]|nr:hypothetical protein [Desulfuromonadales bacterium]